MERKILILCQERPQLSDLRREWQKDGIFARIVSGVGEVACELSRNTDYLLVIIFSDGQEYLTSLKLTRGLTNAPIMVLNRQYDSAEKIAAIKAGADEYIKWSDSYVEEIFASSYALIRLIRSLSSLFQRVLYLLTWIITRFLSIRRKWSFRGMSLTCSACLHPVRNGYLRMNSFTVRCGVTITCGMPIMASIPA